MSREKAALALPFVVFAGVYGAAIGHGFISDDFGWILDSRVQHVRDLAGLFIRTSGFYRPVVGLTFALDYAIFGTHPLGYALTNMALAAGCALLLFQVARELGLPAQAGVLCAALWLLNPHGVSTAIIWMSGRTSLLLTLASLAAALFVLRGHPFGALISAATALLCKEEAVLLPVILFAWWMIVRRQNRPSSAALTMWWTCALALLGGYLALRFQSNAMTPWNAPAYYRFTHDPAVIARNVFEYADRAMTLSAAVALLGWIVMRPRAVQPSRTVVLCGAAWIAGGYGLTVFLPVRSSLYACFPSAGACLIAGDVAARCWAASSDAGNRRAVIAGVVAALAMTPVYVLRDRSTVANARFTSAALERITARAGALPDGSTVLVLDDRDRKPNVETAFNTALADAFELTSGRRLKFWVEPELHYARALGMTPPCPGCIAARVDLRR
jgi:hypothetical protein